MRSRELLCSIFLLAILAGCHDKEPALYTINKKRAFFYDNSTNDNVVFRVEENSVFPICATDQTAPVLCPALPGTRYFMRESDAAVVSALVPKSPWKVTAIEANADSLRLLFDPPPGSTLDENFHPLAWSEERAGELLIHLTPVVPGIRFQRSDENEKQLKNIRWQGFGDSETVITLETGAHLGYRSSWTDPLELVLTFRRSFPAKPKIMLDPGHGQSETGACRDALCEKDLTLRAAKLLSTKLQSAGMDVLLTREADELVSLESRVEKAETANVDLLLSLHTDSWPPGGRLGKPPVGLSCYFQQPFVQPIAATLCSSDPQFPLRHTPWITRRSLYVIHSTQFPSLLLELGNFQDRHDVKILTDEKEFATMVEILGSRIIALFNQK